MTCKDESHQIARWYVYRIPYLNVSHNDMFTECGMQPYIPMKETVIRDSRRKGKIRKVMRPRILNYAFAQGTYTQVEALKKEKYICPVYAYKAGGFHHDPYLTISDRMMQMFMRYVDVEDEVVSVIEMDDSEFEKGDNVEIIGGPLDGFTGTLFTSQGKKGGVVTVKLDDKGNFCFQTAKVEERYLRILEFAPNSHHFVKKVKALEPRVEKVLALRDEGLPVPEKLIEQLKNFLQRYEKLKTPLALSRVKLLVSFWSIYVALGMKPEAEKAEQEIDTLISKGGLPATAVKYIEDRRSAIMG